ncbi:uncharacterized protein LOC106872791 [Octopus bimaculoides]|uniref:uncharacterized protein LOC106872791 n=1 Tax=Octopus bimaculoides TaxID=37653 RepID=UPI0022E079E4|nr:uncharacterized protein LOC106872791 [Octopus bimaculoides]
MVPFFHSKGIFYFHCVSSGQAVTKKQFVEVLREFGKRLRCKRPEHLHQDNAQVHTSILVTNNLTVVSIKTVPYSVELAPCDLIIFQAERDPVLKIRCDKGLSRRVCSAIRSALKSEDSILKEIRVLHFFEIIKCLLMNQSQNFWNAPWTCNGTATTNECGYCVGGETNKTQKYGLDCNNVCNGTAYNDSCNYCVNGVKKTKSDFEDCTGTCHAPGQTAYKAYQNNYTCNICLQWNETLPAERKDACGVCNGNNSTCTDCAGVVNGTSLEDQCGMCNGNGSSCFRIIEVKPKIIPEYVGKTLYINVAGPKDDKMVLDIKGIIPHTLVNSSHISAVVNLTKGTYDIYLNNSQGLKDSFSSLKVYRKSDIVASVSPLNLTLDTKQPSDLSLDVSVNVTDQVQCLFYGAVVEVKFDRPIETAAILTCDKIFTSTTQLGNEAACNWYSDSTLIITVGKGNDLVILGSYLTFANNAVKAKGQSYAIAIESTIVVGRPDQPVSVESVIEGPSEIPNCGFVQYTGTKSRGSGGRQLTYEWTIPNITIVDNTKDSIMLNSSDLQIGTEYTVTLNVKNFLAVIDNSSLIITRDANAIPIVYLSSDVDAQNVQVTDT